MLSEKYPFLMKYFAGGIKSTTRNIAHCILFYGNDIQAQYDIALEISRLLNCKEGGSEDCQCLNCRWIRENKHPAVITISKSDNKSSDDTTKTVISASQAKFVKDSLAVTSDYHRVMIFCDRDEKGNLAGLNQKVFPETAANALLKTFEEPPENTTFFFLTKDKSDMLATIVSRAQCFFVPSNPQVNASFDLVKPAVENYFSLERDQVLDLNDRLYALTKDNDTLDILTEFENYVLAVIESNFSNKLLQAKLIEDLNKIEKAQREIRLGMNPQTVIETLSFELIL
ncbi:hypothetical protein J6E39_00415 [bacterium]|nr:hypothetical protein [bacterium]